MSDNCGCELTSRELEVLTLLAEGCTNKQIATRLDIKCRTVEFHLKNIYQKLDVTTRTEALAKAIKLGWINLES